MWVVQNKVYRAAKKLGAKLGTTPLVAVATTCRALKAHDIRLAAPPHPSLVVVSIIEWGNQHTGLVKGHIEAVEKEVEI